MTKFVIGQAVRVVRCDPPDDRQHLIGTESYVTEIRHDVIYGLACAPILRANDGTGRLYCWYPHELEPVIPDEIKAEQAEEEQELV